MEGKIARDSEILRVSDQLSLKLSLHPNIQLHGRIPTIISDIRIFDKDDVRSMIKVILDLHDLNISLLRLHPSNIVTDHDSGKLKFSGLVFINSSPDSRKNDFRLLARAIELLIMETSFFTSKKFPIPKDLQDVLSIMYNYSYRDSDRDLLLNHLAFKSSSEQLGFIRNTFEKRLFLGPEDKNIYWETMMKHLVRSATNVRDWRPHISNSSFRAVKECLEFKPQPKPVNYQNTNISILQFCRNLATHLPQNLRRYHGYEGTESETYSIIMEHFGDELLSFQYLAHEYGILEHFMPGYTSSTSAGQTCTMQRQDYSRPDVGGRGAHHRTLDRSRGSVT